MNPDAPTPVGIDDHDRMRTGSMVSLRTVQAALRRHRRVWLITAALGFLVGAAIHLAIPARYSAVTQVILIQPPGTDPNQAITNDQSILQSTAVAGRTVAALHLRENANSFASSYRSSVVSTEVLSITVTADSQAEAVRRAGALTTAFLHFRYDEYSNQIGLENDALDARSTALQNNIDNLTASIAAASSPNAPTAIADSLDNLISARATAENALATVQNEIQQNSQNLLSIKASGVLDPATVRVKSSIKVAGTDGLSGLIAGLAIGAGFVSLRSILSQGLRRREDLAIALGADVELSILRWKRPRVFKVSRLSRRLLHPDAQQRAARVRLRHHLDASPGQALAAVSVAAGEFAAVAVAGLALDLASEGRRVAVVDLADGRLLRRLIKRNQRFGRSLAVPLVRPAGPNEEAAADPGDGGAQPEPAPLRPWDQDRPNGYRLRARAARRTPGRGEIKVINGPADPLEAPTETPGEVDAVLTLSTVSPSRGADQVARWATDVVVLVTSGAAPAGLIWAVGEMLRCANLRIRSSFVINPDADDESLGRLGRDRDLVEDGAADSPAGIWLNSP